MIDCDTRAAEPKLRSVSAFNDIKVIYDVMDTTEQMETIHAERIIANSLNELCQHTD